MIEKWNKLYSDDQMGLYKNKVVQKIFDLGHLYITRMCKEKMGTILDIGCGIGYHIKFENLNERRKYIAMDSRPEMLEKIKDGSVKKLVGNCEKIPLGSSSVDVVIASHILEHIANLDACLNEIKRVMKSDGLFLAVIPCDPGFLWNLSTKFSPSRSRLKKKGIDYDVVMKYEHINEFLNCEKKLKSNFKVINQKYFPFFLKSHRSNLYCGLTLNRKNF